jgi:hypothetical protein
MPGTCEVKPTSGTVLDSPHAMRGGSACAGIFLDALVVITTPLGALAIAGAAFSATPVGSEFQVNTYTTQRQKHPAVAANAGGDFVVVWGSNGSSGSDTSFYSVQSQRYLPEPSAVLVLRIGVGFLATVGRQRIQA